MKYKVEFEIEFKHNPYPGKFIVFEGMDASGKTTHSCDLVEKLKNEGHKVIYTKEPTDGEIGKLIREVLTYQIKVPPISLQYLFSADRGVHQEQIKDWLKAGYIVVSDRYFWSSVAYGIADLNGSPDFYLTAFSILSFYHQFISPDYTFFLDVEVDEAVRRIEESKKRREIYEAREKLVKIDNSYEKLIDRFKEEFTVIDANKSIDEVSEELFDRVKKIINNK